MLAELVLVRDRDEAGVLADLHQLQPRGIDVDPVDAATPGVDRHVDRRVGFRVLSQRPHLAERVLPHVVEERRRVGEHLGGQDPLERVAQGGVGAEPVRRLWRVLEEGVHVIGQASDLDAREQDAPCGLGVSSEVDAHEDRIDPDHPRPVSRVSIEPRRQGRVVGMNRGESFAPPARDPDADGRCRLEILHP